MSGSSKLETIYTVRERLFAALQVRKSLGEFDANASVIILLLETQLAILSHVISQAEIAKRSKEAPPPSR